MDFKNIRDHKVQEEFIHQPGSHTTPQPPWFSDARMFLRSQDDCQTLRRISGSAFRAHTCFLHSLHWHVTREDVIGLSWCHLVWTSALGWVYLDCLRLLGSAPNAWHEVRHCVSQGHCEAQWIALVNIFVCAHKSHVFTWLRTSSDWI